MNNDDKRGGRQNHAARMQPKPRLPAGEKISGNVPLDGGRGGVDGGRGGVDGGRGGVDGGRGGMDGGRGGIDFTERKIFHSHLVDC
uniref:Uncharacterized protein n=1 Tax=Caenorhabditis japonica TaxID=281687 RepID=A0A8R1E8E2_CAEJA